MRFKFRFAILEDFIRQFGSTPYGSMARARLEELKKNQTTSRPGQPPAAKAGEPAAPKSSREQKQSPSSSPASSQRFACDRFGCKSVPPNCRVEHTLDDKYGAIDKIICP